MQKLLLSRYHITRIIFTIIVVASFVFFVFCDGFCNCCTFSCTLAGSRAYQPQPISVWFHFEVANFGFFAALGFIAHLFL